MSGSVELEAIVQQVRVQHSMKVKAPSTDCFTLVMSRDQSVIVVFAVKNLILSFCDIITNAINRSVLE